jgi:excisionase family DNA binding protein
VLPRLNSAKPGHIRDLSDAEVRNDMSEPWLSADDISGHLGVTKDTVYAWIADKAMPAHKVGRLWKFQASEVDDWVRSGGAETAGDANPPA